MMPRHARNRLWLLVGALPALWLCLPGAAQVSTRPAAEEPATRRARTREEELHALEARQAQLALEQARTEMDNAALELEKMRTLAAEKLVTVEKLNEAIQRHSRAVLAYKQAQIELDRKRLEFLKAATLVRVVDAKKYRDAEGEVIASVRLRNDSDILKAAVAMEGQEQISPERLKSLLKVDNIIVTLRGEAQVVTGTGPDGQRVSTGRAIVGDPFQRIVPALEHGQEVALEFRLLKKDVENVTVSLEFLGEQKDYDVFLKKESQQDLPTISPAQYSQIGQLGSKITYDLDLERLAKTEQVFSLVVLNLPEEIRPSFLEAASKAMITEVRFTEELSKQRLYFELSIPEKLSPKLIGASIPFHLLVTRRAYLKEVAELSRKYSGQKIPSDEIARLKASSVELALIPRGVGELEIVVPNLFKEIKKGEPAVIKFNILNSGTLALRKVAPTLDLPLEWEGRVEPAEAAVLAPGEKTMFTIHVTPPPEVDIGDYTTKIEAEGSSGVETIEAVEKTLTIRVAAESSITGTVVLVGILVVLVIGIAVASIKISRR